MANYSDNSSECDKTINFAAHFVIKVQLVTSIVTSSDPKSLKAHKRIHTCKKLRRCSLCDTKFAVVLSL